MATKVLAAPVSKKTDLSLATLMTVARRRRFMTVSVISWIIMVILTIAIVVPAIQQIITKMQEIAQIEAVIAQVQAKVTGLESLDTTEIEHTNTILGGAIPKEKPVLPLLYSLDRLATNAQVSISNFQITPGLLGTESGKLDSTAAETTISPNVSALPLRMNVSGGFENLSSFFQSLDDVVPFIQVNTIKFESVGAVGQQVASSSAQYSAAVDLSSLYLKQVPAASDVSVVTPLTESERALIDRLGVAFAQRESDAKQQSGQIASPSGRTSLFSLQ